MSTCIHCQHPKASHNHLGKCRLGGCGCQGFDDGTPKATKPGPRRVAIDVPDGYVLSVTLIPHDPSAPIIEVPGTEPEATS